MGSWIKREDNWLHRPPRAKSAAEPAAQPKKELNKKEEEPPRYGVTYYPLRCPNCRSKDIKTYACKLPVRYHRCNNCGINFKSTEKEEKKVVTTA